MKRTIFVVSLLLTVMSCSRENKDDVETETPPNPYELSDGEFERQGISEAVDPVPFTMHLRFNSSDSTVTKGYTNIYFEWKVLNTFKIEFTSSHKFTAEDDNVSPVGGKVISGEFNDEFNTIELKLVEKFYEAGVGFWQSETNKTAYRVE